MLDHHLSAQEDWNSQLDVSNFLTNITIIFENNESGASMAWRYFNKNVEMPLIVKRARDYDLWHHHDIDTVPLIAALWASDRFKEQDFTLIDDMLDEEKYAEMLKLGTIIEKEKNNLIQSMIATGNHRFVKVSPEISIPVMHVSSTLANHSGTHLNKVAMQRFQEQLFTSQDIEALREVGGLFSATYTENWEEKRRTFSLRSNSKYEYSMDVTTVARRFGGGGHKNSSGFSVPIQVPVHRLFNQGFLAQLHTKFLVWFYTKVNKK
jgi:oligoribonuclease NrnB/cAMP/cGMP phosphodiesterase (DHH superfamily)